MQLTEKERDLLVDTLIEALWQFPLENTHRSVREMIVHKAIMPNVEGLLADHAVPEPDAGRIARAAKAIEGLDWDVDEVGFLPTFADMARAALAAAGDDLDAMLDSVWGDSGPVEIDDLVWSDADNQWSVWIKSCYTFRHVDADHPLYHVEHGTGPTRKAAVLDAVAKAKGASDADPTS